MTPVQSADRRRTFCGRLKSERERRDTSLTAIAESTKIKASLLEALERGDLSRWPKGLYRRAFFRDYVVAIGLAPDPLLREFLDVFAEVDPSSANGARMPLQEPQAFRLMLGDGKYSHMRPSSVADRPVDTRIMAAAIDLAAIATVSFLVHAIVPVQAYTVALVIGTLFYGATAWFGRSPSEGLLQQVSRSPALTASPAASSPLPANALVQVQPFAASAWFERLAEAFYAPSALRSHWRSVSDSVTLIFDPQRRRDLEAMRRQRVEAASHPPVDDVSVSSHVVT